MSQVVIILLIICLFYATARIILLHRQMEKISVSFKEKASCDTNTLIGTDFNDKALNTLVKRLNDELIILREKRHRYEQGDAELKNAIANISHDLRTPLTAICGYTELVKEQDLSENTSKYVNIIGERAEHMKQMLRQLFEYSLIVSRKVRTEMGPVDIKYALEESIAASFESLTKRGIEPDISLPQGRILKTADRQSVLRIYENILNNAVKYSGGDLTVKMMADGTTFFSNSAPGLTRVQAEKLFDRFYTVRDMGGSTGLGLTIARTLTSEMGGSISSVYENNTLTIRLSLPD